ncbi:MAG: preprotein translocase subunit SecG [Alphaproteobacteria bacterium]|nr:preprotein translocase subunit SecG [Alphaproteobacteria bacterium]
MGSVLLVIHLITAIFLVAIILMQRSSGGALNGLGGGSGANSFLSARGTGNLLTRLTAILATVFFITSISLALYYKGAERKSSSILDIAPVAQNVPVATDAPQVPVVPSVPEAK